MNYKVTKISEQEPKKWNGPNGVIYYIKVMLEGHAKPVEIGKKSPDAIKAGDELNGTIISTEYQSDKFKAEPKPFGGGKTEDPAKQDSIIRQSSMKAAVDLVVSGKIDVENLYDRADEIVAWVKGEYKNPPQLIKPDALKNTNDAEETEPNFMDDDINLDDIPF